jgi:YidC/Oxa1 family membrane protein insertase
MNTFELLIFQPLYNFLALLSGLTKGNLGWAVLILAAIIRLIIWPWYKKAMGDQRKMAKLQPRIKEIQKKLKEEPIKANQEIMKIFKEEKINPGNSFFFIFFQMAIFISLFIFFKQAIGNDWSPYLYSFIKLPEQINYLFLGFINLKAPSLILAIVSASLNSFLTFIQPSSGQNKVMLLGFPFIILFFYQKFPAVIILYWVGFTLINILQEYMINKHTQEENQTISMKTTD